MNINTSEQSRQAAMDQFGRQISLQLDATCQHLPYDISERLRAARVRAVEMRKQVLVASAQVSYANTLSDTLIARHSGHHSPWWNRLGVAGLLLLLLTGLLIINIIQDDLSARELADIDTAILTDDLPPAAYIDVGFAQFLKLGNPQEP